MTGFKFIGNTALDLTKAGYDVPFGYEEAIGFMISREIRDKDGVSATVCVHTILNTGHTFNYVQLFFAELAAHLHSKQSDVYSYLQELYSKYVLIEALHHVPLNVLTQIDMDISRYEYFDCSRLAATCLL